jgi:hypothetical protein
LVVPSLGCRSESWRLGAGGGAERMVTGLPFG